MKKIIPLIHLTVGYLFLLCYSIIYNTSSALVYQTHNIFTIPIYCFICYILFHGWKIYPSLNKNKWIFPVIGCIYSSFLIFGTSIRNYNFVSFVSIITWLSIFTFSYVMTAALLFIYHRLLPQLYKICTNGTNSKIESLYARVNFFHFWIALIVFWIPYLLACYPGIASYDANYQLSQVGETLNLTAHHPIIHTLLLGGCVQFGRLYFNSANIGMLIYSLIQIIIISGIMAYCLHFLKKHNVSAILCFISFIFFAFMPFNGLFAICATKDSIFGALFLLLIILQSEMNLNSSSFFNSKKYTILLILVIFLLLTFRNNMLYALLLSVIFMLFAYRKYWKQILCICFIPILLLQLYQTLLYPKLNVAPGNSREAYSVIMQQFANVYNNCTIDSDDKKLLLELMDDECWQEYEPRKSDAIKNHFKTTIFTDNIETYLKLWIKLGIQNPTCYLNAFFNLTYAYWYPNDILPDQTTYRKYIEIYDCSDISFDSKIPSLFKILKKIGMEASYQNYPVISVIFTPAFYIWILLFVFAVNFYNQKFNFIKLLIFPATIFLTLLLGPVALLRYLYPIIICVPFLIPINTKF